MLTKRTYLVPVLAAAIALPASARRRRRPPDGPLGGAAGRASRWRRPSAASTGRSTSSTGGSRAERRAELRRKRREAFASLPGGVSQETLDAIAACESGGDPTAVSSDGTYRGKYQFDYGTWESVGGSGDPAAAPEAEQDYRAALLYSESGSSPWPVCG